MVTKKPKATVTTIYKGVKRRLFLKENREAKGISAEVMAGRLGIERESVYRLEREAQTRCTPEKQIEYADALNIEPAALWQLPGAPDLNALVSSAPKDVQTMVVDVVRRMVGKG